MSDRLSPEQFAELRRLIQAMHDEQITPEEAARLDAWLLVDEEARRVYVQYMYLCARLRWDHRKQPFEGQKGAVPRKKESGGVPVLGFLGDALQAGASFLSRSFVLTLLLTVGLPAVLLAILLIQIGSQPKLKPPAAVATISQTHRCVWEEGGAPVNGFGLPPGERIVLRKGLVELAFTGGATVLLEGPAIFEATGGGRGFLRAGSLVANVPKGAGGFTVETPAITVVDLGTEFGVRAERQRKASDVEVFCGKVELHAASKVPSQIVRHPLVAGQAATIEVADQQDAPPVIRPRAPLANAFVRHMPGPVVADFSGGPGDAQSDQFPGAAGAGWATGWDVRGVAELTCSAAIDEASPLLGGGKYMRVVMERKPVGTNKAAWAGVDRRVETKGPVDLTKRYTVSFNVRVDKLARLSKATDRVSICSRSQSQAEHAVSEAGSSIGWFISIARDRSKPGEPAQWFLYYRGDGRVARMSSGISVREGAVYSFRILVDPQAGQWTPSIAVDGGAWTAFSPMSMRSAKTAEENRYWPYWHCYWMTHFGKEGEVAEKMELSIDSLRVIPE